MPNLTEIKNDVFEKFEENRKKNCAGCQQLSKDHNDHECLIDHNFLHLALFTETLNSMTYLRSMRNERIIKYELIMYFLSKIHKTKFVPTGFFGIISD